MALLIVMLLLLVLAPFASEFGGQVAFEVRTARNVADQLAIQNAIDGMAEIVQARLKYDATENETDSFQDTMFDDDLKERLLTWDLLQPGQFPAMLEERTKAIHNRALTLFGMKAADFDALFAAA